MFKKASVPALASLFLASFAAAEVNFDNPKAGGLGLENAGAAAVIPAAAPASRTAGQVLVPAKTIQLLVESNSLELADYSAVMSVRCSYRSGLAWPMPRSCGTREVPVEINDRGQLLVPAIEAFEGAHGSDLDSFTMMVTLRKKGDDKGYLFSMVVGGKKAFRAYAGETSAYSILNMKAAKVEVLVEGAPLAGSELSQDPDSGLLSSVSIEHRPGDLDGVIVVTPLAGTRGFRNHGDTKVPLSGFTALSLSGAFVEKAGDARKLELAVKLRSGVSLFWQSRIEIEKTVDGLEKIRQVNLKK